MVHAAIISTLFKMPLPPLRLQAQIAASSVTLSRPPPSIMVTSEKGLRPNRRRRKMRTGKSIRLTAVFTLALAALLAVPATALAGPGGRGGGHRGPHGDMNPGMRMRMLAERLDLSEEQRAQVRAMSEQHREATLDMRAQLRDARRALREAINAEDSDETTIRSAAAAVAAVEADLAVARAQHRKAFEALLTPEQLEQLKQMKNDMPRRGFGGGSHGPHGYADCPFTDD
jgi:protein CpxP